MAVWRKKAGLGPLPKADRNSELQELSIRAFEGLLPVSKFLFRGKPTDDFGVDGTLELKIDAYATNLLAQVQLKSVETAKPQKSGAISLSVDVSNVNYMLNGQSPLYVLYIAERGEIRYLWARDERKRLDRVKPDWMQQRQVSLHFCNVLTPASVDKIHERIRKEAQLQRRIHDTLARASTAERIFLNIDPETLTSIDPDEAFELLMTSGASYISAGYAPVMLKLFDFISPVKARTPRLQMVRGFAYFTTGKYQSALAHVVEAILHSEELESDDWHFLMYLKDACDFQRGSIDQKEFLNRQAQRAEREVGLQSLEYHLDALRQEYILETEPSKRKEIHASIGSVVKQILGSHNASSVSKMQARLTLLHAEGVQSVYNLLDELSVYKMRTLMGYPEDHQGYIEVLGERFNEWETDMAALIQEAKVTLHPVVLGDAYNTRVLVRIFKLSTLHTIGNLFSDIPEEVILANMEEAQQAVVIHELTESLEAELNSRMLVADLFELAEQPEASRNIAVGILPKAIAMNYSGLIARAKAHISGETLLGKAEKRRKTMVEDEDFRLSTASSEDIKQLTQTTLKALKLPQERFAVLELGHLASRDAASERVHWCRHLQVLEHLGHTANHSTLYATDPERVCRCDKYFYQSAVGSPNWKQVIKDFKEAYCLGCRSREPKSHVAS